MAHNSQDLKDIVTSIQEKQSSLFLEKIQNIKEKFENLSDTNNKELDKICENLGKIDDRLRSAEGICIQEQQKFQDHIDRYMNDLAKLEKRLDDANNTIESLKQWRYIQLGAVGIISAIITIIMGAAVAYITKIL
jgi:predicted nuclease with TOPRIM domain